MKGVLLSHTQELQHALRAVVGASQTLAQLGYVDLAAEFCQQVAAYDRQRPRIGRTLRDATRRARKAITELDNSVAANLPDLKGKARDQAGAEVAS